MFLTGEQIYHNFTEAVGPADLVAAANEIRRIAEEYDAQYDEILRLAEKMEQAWQGDSAGAAQRGAGPLAVAHADASPLIHQSQDLSARQAGSFHDAKNAVRPVPPMPERPDPWAAIFSLDATATHAVRMAEYRAAVQHNVDVMTGYSRASVFNTTGQPMAFGTIDPDNGAISVASTVSGPTGPPPRLTGGAVQRPDRPVLPSSQPGEIPDPVPHDHHQPDVVEHPAADLLTPVARHETPATHTAAATAIGPDTTDRVRAPASETSSQPGMGTIGTQSSSKDSRVLFRLDGRDASARPGSGRPVGGSLRGGVGSLPDTTGVPRGGAVPQGGHYPVVPTGKPRAAEDEEHQRPEYLRERDPESAFGTDEPTTPPVIE